VGSVPANSGFWHDVTNAARIKINRDIFFI
jgi:hypothetical protein